MKKIKSYSVIFILAAVVVLPILADFYVRSKVEAAASSMPYQVGITNAVVTQCQTSCCSVAGCRCCTGGMLCSSILTEPQCLLHSDVSGSMAGGMGSNVLFLNTAIMQAGLKSGGQLIAGGMAPTMMDQGVLASAGGCSGCSMASRTDRMMDWLSKFSIASLLK